MIKKKVCMLGTSAVGKTSLVSRFVLSVFSEKYQTSVGVKTDKKVVTVDDQEVTMVLWDLEGDDDFKRIETTYLRGSSGYLLVADGTRQITLDQALDIQSRVETVLGKVPFVLALNKADLVGRWEIGDEQIAELRSRGWKILRTSAKDDEGVEGAFLELARAMLQEPGDPHA